MYYLGVDAGGSHCRARLTDADGTVLGTGQSGPANTRIGLELLHARLIETCAQATTAAGLSEAKIATIQAGMGIAGITRSGANRWSGEAGAYYTADWLMGSVRPFLLPSVDEERFLGAWTSYPFAVYSRQGPPDLWPPQVLVIGATEPS